MYSGERQASALRKKYLEAVLKQDVGFFDTDARTGDIVFSVSTDTLLVQDAISEKVRVILFGFVIRILVENDIFLANCNCEYCIHGLKLKKEMVIIWVVGCPLLQDPTSFILPHLCMLAE